MEGKTPVRLQERNMFISEGVIEKRNELGGRRTEGLEELRG